MALETKYRGFIIEISKIDGGYENYYYKVKRLDGSLIHTFDIDECELFDTEDDAIEAAKEVTDEFLDN